MHPIPSALNARSARASFVPGVQMNVGATHFTVMLSLPHCRQMNRELHRREWFSTSTAPAELVWKRGLNEVLTVSVHKAMFS
jgi:hypothetical protein